jgi:hypothetical protein
MHVVCMHLCKARLVLDHYLLVLVNEVTVIISCSACMHCIQVFERMRRQGGCEPDRVIYSGERVLYADELWHTHTAFKDCG